MQVSNRNRGNGVGLIGIKKKTVDRVRRLTGLCNFYYACS